MKLYVLQCGVLYSDKGVFVRGNDGTPFNVPVPYYLIEHEKGYVLFDSGHNKNTIENPHTLHPVIQEAFKPAEIGSGYVLDALKQLNVKPEDIVYHICSHLHFDHAGGIGLFPNATYIVQKEELIMAFDPTPEMAVVYFREDFDKNINWKKLDGFNDHLYDVFNDGKLIIHYTPGHTPGHQSLQVNLTHDASMLLTQDACFTEENLNELILPASVHNPDDYVKTLKHFQTLQAQGIKIVTGHDPQVWLPLKKAPEFYS